MQQRKSPRLKDYDYTHAGAYFVTVCTHQRLQLFGEIDNGVMRRTWMGDVAAECWFALPTHHAHIELDVFVVMPNHIHGLLFLVGTRPASSGTVKEKTSILAGSLGAIVGSYKASVTRSIRQRRNDPSKVVWQGRYHDHIIRNERSLNAIREYVIHNPALWEKDTFYSPGTP